MSFQTLTVLPSSTTGQLKSALGHGQLAQHWVTGSLHSTAELRRARPSSWVLQSPGWYGLIALDHRAGRRHPRTAAEQCHHCKWSWPQAPMEAAMMLCTGRTIGDTPAQPSYRASSNTEPSRLVHVLVCCGLFPAVHVCEVGYSPA